jgi:GT2 family glycosyltransferase
MSLSVSILLNTLDRYALTVRCIGKALADAGYPFEFIACDNGSQDKRVIDYINTLNPAYFRLNETNEGCAMGHNQMILRSKGELLVFLDNDIEMQAGWLKSLVSSYEHIKSLGMAAGVSGIHSIGLGPVKHPPVNVGGLTIHPAIPPMEDAIFGTRMFDRAVLETVGYFSEGWGPYGLVDNAYNSRVHHSGFINYYVDFPSAMHLDLDMGQNTPYRKMKDEEMKKAGPLFVAEMARMGYEKNYYVPPPAMR